MGFSVKESQLLVSSAEQLRHETVTEGCFEDIPTLCIRSRHRPLGRCLRRQGEQARTIYHLSGACYHRRPLDDRTYQVPGVLPPNFSAGVRERARDALRWRVPGSLRLPVEHSCGARVPVEQYRRSVQARVRIRARRGLRRRRRHRRVRRIPRAGRAKLHPRPVDEHRVAVPHDRVLPRVQRLVYVPERPGAPGHVCAAHRGPARLPVHALSSWMRHTRNTCVSRLITSLRPLQVTAHTGAFVPVSIRHSQGLLSSCYLRK